MNMISTGAFQSEMDASSKTETLVGKLVSAWEKKNAKVARAGGVSLMALSLAACGSSSDDDTSSDTAADTTTVTTPVTPTVDAAKVVALTTSTDSATGGSGDDTFSGVVQAQGGTGTTAFPGDRIDGGSGTDEFVLTMAGAHTGAYAVSALDVDNVENYKILNYETSGNDTTIDTSLNSGVTTYTLGGSVAAGVTILSNVAGITDAAMENGAANFTMTYLAAAVSGTADTQNLAISNLSNGTFTANGAETIAVTTGLVKSTMSNIASNTLTKVTVSGSTDLTVSTAIDFVAGTNNDTTIDATIDASGLTGKLTVTADTNDHSITGGSGNDTINMLGLLTTNDHIDGGAGTDTLTLNQAALSTEFTNVSNIETVKFNADDSSTAAVAYNLSKLSAGVTTVAIDVNDNNGANNSDNITNQTSESIVVRNTADDTANGNTKVTIANKTDTASDSVNISVIEVVEGSDKTDIDSLSAANYETVTISSEREAATTTAQHNDIDALVVGSATTLNITGDQQLTIGGITGGAMTKFDASGLSGKLSATFSSADKITATAAQSDTTFAFGATMDNNDTVVGGASAKDTVTATLTGATATTGALNITDVETVTLTTSGDNTLNMAGIVNANTIAVSANTQTITGFDLGATLQTTAAATVKLTAADASGTADTLKIQQKLDGDVDNIIEASDIETISIDVYDTGATANTAGFDLDTFKGTKVVFTQNVLSSTNVNVDLAGTTLYKTVSSVDSTATKGTATFTAANATQAVTFDLGGTGAANATGGAYGDTFNIASTTAAHTVSGGGGADVVNMTTAGATDVSSIDAETVNVTVAAGTDADVSGGTFHSGVDTVVVTGGNSLSTFTTGTIHTNLKSVDASAMGGNSVMTLGDDTADTTITLKGGSLLTDTLAFQLSGTNMTATLSGIDTIDGNVDGDDTVNLANASGVVTVELDIADGKTATVSNVGSEVIRVTDGDAAAQVTGSLVNSLGASDSISFELKDDGTNGAGSLDVGFNVGTTDIETVNIKVSTVESVDLSTLAMATAGATMSLNLTGTSALTVSALNMDVTTLDASGMGSGGSVIQTGRSADAASTYTGTAGNDTFIMMNAADVLDAGTGTGDTLDINVNAVIGAGNIDLSSTGDQVTTLNGVSNAAVQKGFDHADASGYTGGFAVNITGNANGNTLTGSGAKDQISGGAGTDSITGGQGADTMTGGTGIDTFVVSYAATDSQLASTFISGTTTSTALTISSAQTARDAGVDVITDIVNTDLLDLDDDLGAADVLNTSTNTADTFATWYTAAKTGGADITLADNKALAFDLGADVLLLVNESGGGKLVYDHTGGSSAALVNLTGLMGIYLTGFGDGDTFTNAFLI